MNNLADSIVMEPYITCAINKDTDTKCMVVSTQQ